MRRLLIAESSEQIASALAELLEDRYEISTCNAGDIVMDYVRLFQPDFVVLDMMMPGLDGISILEAMRFGGYSGRILAVIRHGSDYTFSAASRMNVDYIMRKPCSLRAMATRIVDMDATETETQPMIAGSGDVLDRIYFELGMKTGSDAYKELVEATRILLRDPGAALTKEVYPEVGKRFKKEKNQVERAIARTIEYAWKQREVHIWSKYFPQNCLAQATKPSNGYFLSRIVGYVLQLEQDTLL